MGGSDQPYLYDPPSNRNSQITYPYSDFNPRAATQAHYAALAERAERQKRKAAQEGKPLINFNQHPDSYMIVNNPVTNFEPMSPNTKRNIIWTRWAQFMLRVIQEIGAVGILVCVICLKMNNDGPGWIIRVAPAWDSVITIYAIYHLLRPAKGRTPGSSSSYHFFALFMDTGLIPFYIFVALYANDNYNEEPGTDGRWTSFFNTNFATTTIIYVTYLASIVVGGLHLVSVVLDLYLIVMFRKIAQLPPDMNPLEDNLTGSTRRSRSQKHKYKNSEASVSTYDMSEKNKGYLSGSTLDVSDSRLSTATAKEPEVRTIPFGHSRMDSSNNYSPHNPNSARLSRQAYDEINLYQGPRSARSSRVDVADGHRSRAGTVVSGPENSSAVDFAEIPPVPASYSNVGRANTPKNGSFANSTPDRVQAAPSNAIVKSQQKQSLLNDNWYVLDEQDASADLGTPRHASNKENVPPNRQPTLPNVQLDRYDSFEPQPLKMNPPTPPPPMHHEEYPDPEDIDTSFQSQKTYNPVEIGVARTLTVASQNTNSSSIYSESAPELNKAGRHPNNATPKGKYYGDLASATRNIRGGNVPGLGGYGVPSPQQSPQKSAGRVVSRTGVDIADAGMHEGYGAGLRGRRDVSGKIAEEGRSTPWR